MCTKYDNSNDFPSLYKKGHKILLKVVFTYKISWISKVVNIDETSPSHLTKLVRIQNCNLTHKRLEKKI